MIMTSKDTQFLPVHFLHRQSSNAVLHVVNHVISPQWAVAGGRDCRWSRGVGSSVVEKIEQIIVCHSLEPALRALVWRVSPVFSSLFSIMLIQYHYHCILNQSAWLKTFSYALFLEIDDCWSQL
ncbi:hypothetical protein VTO42DRAFT_8305 [Malbranchea cinnamomea]